MMEDRQDVQTLPIPVPVVFPETEPFWRNARKGKLLLPFCRHCEKPVWYPKAFCNACGHFELDWREASGFGEIYSFTDVMKGEGAYRDTPGYSLALIDLDEGVRMLSNVVDYSQETLRIGQRVKVVFHNSSDDTALPRFTPA
ncbi:Zn-ribbon domain-containing OB-fold protein [Agrobacterium vitis]|uniref:Zn-ribbon domain-containing OB-fold protein n=1 Tax=Agrobacterium vitis TaxID=373 RepID=UPI001F47A5C5|nr:OB-fold domain-containing protein [Agrobacterium vitis]